MKSTILKILGVVTICVWMSGCTTTTAGGGFYTMNRYPDYTSVYYYDYYNYYFPDGYGYNRYIPVY